MAPPTRRPGEIVMRQPPQVVTPQAVVQRGANVTDVVQKVKLDFEARRRFSDDIRSKISQVKAQIIRVKKQIGQQTSDLASLNAGMAYEQRQSDTMLEDLTSLGSL